MNEGLNMLDLIILLALAVFFISRLRKVLGKQIDDSSKDSTKPGGRGPTARVVSLRNPKGAPVAAAIDEPLEDDAPLLADISDPNVSKGLMEIKAADPGFNVREFLNGSKIAFEMIIEAYAKGDKVQLRDLLSRDVYAEFERVIDDAQKLETREETTLVAIQSADIVRAALKGRNAEITVNFMSEQITVERDRKGEIVSGDPAKTELVADEWTFMRDVRSPNPNWTLVAT
jgi:predicted lipid-binding transport protein (Tim44 family)